MQARYRSSSIMSRMPSPFVHSPTSIRCWRNGYGSTLATTRMTVHQRDTNNMLPNFVAEQIGALSLDPGKPLVVTDADEVIVQFVAPLEDFLDTRDCYLDLTSFRLTGNVKSRKTDIALAQPEVMALLDDFFFERAEYCPVVAGAVDALQTLSGRAEILVLSNIPADAKEARVRCLSGHGIPYPLIANKGLKGPAVRAICENRRAPTVFLDDLPQNHASVAEDACHVHRIHFIADARLAKLLSRAEDADVRIDNWPEAQIHMERFFEAAGY